MKKTFWILLIALVAFSCSQESSSIISRSFHNLTAHYNAYFLAKEKMLEIEGDIERMQIDDFNVIIDVLPKIDSSQTKSLKGKFDYCMEKASLPVTKHKNSNWVDDGYILIGKVRMYQGKNNLAIQTFRYVVQKSPDERAKQLALAYLLRCYMEDGDELNAEEIIQILDAEKLDKETEKVYHLNRAHFYHKQRKYDEMPKSLLLALPHIKKKDYRARLHFILGQLYQRNNQSELALKHYTKATKRNPPYETEFFARLNRSREINFDNPKSVKKSEKFYAYSAKEEKNAEYQGKIYYEKGLFELKRGNVDSSIALLSLAASFNDKYASQKGYTFLKLGELFFEYEPIQPQKESYKQSKLYYDSTISYINPTIENFKQIKEQHDLLTEFVKHITTIEKEDTLQKLATLDSIALVQYVDNAVATEIRRQRSIIEQKRREKKKPEFVDNSGTSSPFTRNTSNFIFYNASALSTSKQRFIDIWGERKLSDDWRRSRREIDFTLEEEVIDSSSIADSSSQQQDDIEEEIIVDRNQFTKDIPKTDEELSASNERIIVALYKLGKIYDFQLNDPARAFATYEQLTNGYPGNKYEAEVLYSLFVLCSKNEFCNEDKYAKKLFEIYPNSIFAKLAKDPDYVLNYEDENKKADQAYERAYDLFVAGQYYQADIAIDNVFKNYPNSVITDKLTVLRALILAKRNKIDAYKAALLAFRQDYKTSNLVPFVEDLIIQADSYQREQTKVELVVIDTTYNFNLGEKHYFITFLTSEDRLYRELLGEIYLYNAENYPNDDFTANLYNFGRLALLRVGLFDFRQLATNYGKNIDKKGSFFHKYDDIRKESFIITKSNLNILLSSKDLDGYRAFYKDRYKNFN